MTNEEAYHALDTGMLGDDTRIQGPWIRYPDGGMTHGWWIVTTTDGEFTGLDLARAIDKAVQAHTRAVLAEQPQPKVSP